MKTISVNVNGIRAAAKAGLFDWLKQINADVICLQEIKATEDQLSDDIFHLPGYQRFLFSAEKKGYSGVGIYSKIIPDKIQQGLGFALADQEGRYLQIDIGKLSIASVYLPSGTSGEDRQACKYEFMRAFEPYLLAAVKSDRHYIFCGDWNIAHTNIDLKNWKSNQKNSGFLPDERAWLDKLFSEVGLVDAFRVLNQEAEQYTWWSYRGQAYAKNVGWRIDYQLVTPQLKNAIQSVSIYKEKKFSDHAPLLIDYHHDF